jgi:hypothetical protein
MIEYNNMMAKFLIHGSSCDLFMVYSLYIETEKGEQNFQICKHEKSISSLKKESVYQFL